MNWLKDIAGDFLDFVDNRHIIRRVFIGVVLWQFIDVYLFAKQIAVRPGMSGVELAAIIGALTVPVTALSGILFKLYGDGRSSA